MPDISCDLYHHTDGQCCDEFSTCWHNAPIRVIPLEPKRLNDELVTQMSLRTLIALVAMFGVLGLGASIYLDGYYKNRDLIDQEITWRLRP